MATLKAEKRDMNVKAKALRRQGLVTGNIFGKDMSQTLPIQISEMEAGRFLKAHTKGSQAIIELGEEKLHVQLKDVTYDPMKHQYTNVDFQALVEGEKVTSTAQIVLLNLDKVQGFLTHNLTEISYKAMPSALVEKIEIDASQLKIGTGITVGDLDIAKNKDIDLITPVDTLIAHVAEHQKGGVEEDAEEEAEETPAKANA